MSMLAMFMLAGEPCHWMKDLGFWVLDMVPKIENQMEEKMGNCAYVWALHGAFALRRDTGQIAPYCGLVYSPLISPE